MPGTSTETTPMLAPTPQSINTQGAGEDKKDVDAEKDAKNNSSFSFRGLSHREKLTIVMMALVNFCACACFGVLAPFFPAEAHSKGVTQSVVGFIFSTFELVIFISSPIYGNFLGVIGPHFLLTAGIMTCGTTAILFGLLDQSPPGWIFILLCFLIRSVEALGCSAFITASFAIIANTFPSNVATVMGVLETFSGIGMMAGPPIGGALFQLGGYGLPFWVLGSVLILCGITTAIFLPPQEGTPERRKGSVLTLLRSCRSWVTVFMITTCSFGLGFMDPTLADHLSVYKLMPAYVGLVFLIAPGIYGFTAPLWGWIADAKGLVLSFMVGGTLFSAVSFLTLGPCPLLSLPRALWLDCTSLAVLGLALGCAFIPCFPSLILAAQDLGMQDNMDTYGMVSGLFNSGFSLGAFLGPTFGGILQEHFGFGWAATVSAGLLLLAGTVAAGYGVAVRSGCAARGQKGQGSAGQTEGDFPLPAVAHCQATQTRPLGRRGPGRSGAARWHSSTSSEFSLHSDQHQLIE